jgi:hypothetical protein
MKANEFRLGNWISDGEGLEFQITMITPDKIEAGPLMISSLGLEAEDYGLPITEEWLLKFGFSEDLEDIDYHLHENGFTIHFDINDGHLECYLESVGIDISYVHQLQNLYFALTGKELLDTQKH